MFVVWLTRLIVATKNIVRSDFVDFFATAIVRSRHMNYRPPRPVLAARPTPKPRPPAPRNPGASPTTGHGKTPISLRSTAVLGLALPSVARVPADTAGFQTRYPGALASQRLSTVLDLEVSLPPGWASTHRTRGARTYPDDVTRQRWLGRTTDSRRVANARHPHLPSDCRKIHGPSS